MGNERNDPETNGTNKERRASKSNGTASEDFVDDDKVGDITWSSTGDENDDGMPLETMSPSVMCARPLEETDLVASKTHVPRGTTPSITSSPRPLGKLATITTNGPTSYSSSAPTDAPPVRQPLGKLSTLTVNDSAAITTTTTDNNHARIQGHNHNEQPMTTDQQPSTANPFIQDMLNRQTSSAAFVQQLHETSPSPIPSSEEPSPSPQGRPARPPSQPGAFPSTFSETFSEDDFDLHNRDGGTGNDNVSNPFRDHQPHRPSTSGLVEATPVSQQLTIHGSARPVDLEAQTTTTLATKEKRDQETNKLMALVGLCVVALVMVGVVLYVSAGGGNTDLVIVPVTNTSNSTGSMESPVPSTNITTLPSGLKLDLPMQLPEATLHTIRQDVDGITPQYKAYQWMQQDPYLTNYLHDEPRLIQRYVAVTFYYATHGESWDERGGGTVTVFTDGTGNPLQGPPNHNGNGRLLQENSGNGYSGGGGGNNGQQGESKGGSGSGGSGAGGDHRQQGGGGGGGNSNGGGGSGGGGTGGSSGGNRPPRPHDLPSPSEDRHVNITSEEWLSYNTSECSWYSTASFRPFQEACDENQTLTFLGVMQNNLQGQLPEELALLTDLEELQVSRNRIGGPIISRIGALTNLKGLHLFSNELTGTVPSEIGLLSDSLVKVGLFENQLTGSLPPEFFQLKYVTDMKMSTNKLTGTLPPDIGVSMPKLQFLQITRNEISGAIPPSLGLLTGLKEIVLHDNRFSSSIPTELGLSRRLEKLFAPNNLLGGPIPSELGLLEELKSINLEGNAALSGTLPTELAFLNGTLRSMRLEGTSISGTIPDELCSLRSLKFDCLPPTLCGCDCACNVTES